MTDTNTNTNTNNNNNESSALLKKGRRMSFSSAGLTMGTFPPETNVCEPTINIALYFKTCPSVKALEKLASKMLQYERLSGIPKGTDGKNNWHFHQLPPINVSRLVRTVTANGEKALHALMEQTVNQDELRNPTRDGLPWFELVRFVNTNTDTNGKNGTSVVLFRVDHSVGDGFAMMNIFETICMYADGTPMSRSIPSMSKKSKNTSHFSFGGLLTLIGMILKTIVAFVKVLTLATTQFDDEFLFRAGIGKKMKYTATNRKQIILPDIPLDFVKKLKNTNSTVNDVMFAILSQTIHDYCKANNDPVLERKGHNLQSRVLMPVALPRPTPNDTTRPTSLQNRWVLLSVNLAVGIRDPIERLKTITQITSKLKHSPMAYVQNFVQSSIAPLLPISLARQTVYDTFIRHSMVLTNVPGPKQLVSFGGETVESCQLMFHNLIPNCNVISYCGMIHCCLSMDADLIPGVEEMLPIHFVNSFIKLAKELNVDVPKSVLALRKR